MSEKLNVQDVMRLGASVGLVITEYESADMICRLDRQIDGLAALDNVDTDGVRPMYGIDGDEPYKLERKNHED